MAEYKELEKKIQYCFSDPQLLQTALTHSSYSREHEASPCNERLEFIGDAFFDAIIGEELFRMFPDEEEGFLSRARASLVCEKSLAQEARQLNLGEYLRLGHGEEKAHGREKESILADAMEAVLAAVYLDGGFECAFQLVKKLWPDESEMTMPVTDNKTALQEALQARGLPSPEYRTLAEEGPAHLRKFTVGVYSLDREAGRGTGSSKKKAEQAAAGEALRLLHIAEEKK